MDLNLLQFLLIKFSPQVNGFEDIGEEPYFLLFLALWGPNGPPAKNDYVGSFRETFLEQLLFETLFRKLCPF